MPPVDSAMPCSCNGPTADTMTNEYLQTERAGGVAIITLDRRDEKLNTLSSDALGAIEDSLNEAAGDPDVKAVVIESGKPDNFVVGADVEELRRFDRREQPLALSRRAHALIRKVRGQHKPTVAAIHGPALGGGLELALACTYRVAARDAGTRFGLPEVRLGLIPGGGGTQLLPRLVGIQQALTIMLTGRNVYPVPARRMGLVDVLTHRAGLRDAAVAAAEALASGDLVPDRGGPSMVERALEATSATRRILFRKARQRVDRQTRGNYPAPRHIIEVVRRGIENGLDAGFEAEAASFSELVFSDVAQELIYLFFSQRNAQRNPWRGAARTVRSIGILGGGLMGGGIAALSAENGLDVTLKDISLDRAASARRITYARQREREAKRAISAFERDAITERVRPVDEYPALAQVDLVIEAVPEKLELKQQVLAEIESVVRDTCIIASNTSSIPITRIVEGAQRPERVLGMHYFSPVPQVPLLEIIRHEANPDDVVATAFEAGLAQGKTVIIVNDGPGFYTTRILAIYMNEALLLLEEGGDIRAIDSAMKDFGFPMGPYALFDLVGIDVAASIDDVLAPHFAERGITSSDRARRLVDVGLTGQKSRAGFYRYTQEDDAERPARQGINENVYAHFGGTDRRPIDPRQVQDRLSLIMINEAVRCLEEGILNSPIDGDVGAVFGLGFPPFHGGPFRYIDRTGLGAVAGRLETLRDVHGIRFEPAPLLSEMARNRERFHS